MESKDWVFDVGCVAQYVQNTCELLHLKFVPQNLMGVR